MVTVKDLENAIKCLEETEKEEDRPHTKLTIYVDDLDYELAVINSLLVRVADEVVLVKRKY